MKQNASEKLRHPGLNFWKHHCPIETVFFPQFTMGTRFTKCIIDTDFKESGRMILRKHRSDSITETSFDIMLFDSDNLSCFFG